MSKHIIEYSRSGKASCSGATCSANGTTIDSGSLRYGQTVVKNYSETVEWRHWGCVTPDILRALAELPSNNVPGIKNLRPVDQQKVKRAIMIGRVEPTDAPAALKATITAPVVQAHATQRPPPSAASSPIMSTPGSSQSKKRTRLAEPLTPAARPFPMSQTEDDVVENEVTEEEVRDELYCVMRTSVVGIQYYNGLVGPGENVVLVREPRNQYDPNAIQVKNIGGAQVGHIPKGVAAKLASLLDLRLVTCEGIMITGNLARSSTKQWSLDMTLRIYGASDKRALLEPRLIWATPNQRGFSRPGAATTNHQLASPQGLGAGSSAASSSSPSKSSAASRLALQQAANRAALASQPSSSQERRGGTVAGPTPAQVEAARKLRESLEKAAELKEMLATLETVDDEGRRGSLLDTLLNKDDILNLPLHPSPPGIKDGTLKVDLLPHQSQALQWCVDHENPVLPKKETDKPVQFWQYRPKSTSVSRAHYYNIATKTPQEMAPILGRGGLCADAMGLGKTLTMLALMIATKNDHSPGVSKTTLIVCPVSILSNWEKQIADHCSTGTLNACLYYGNNRAAYTAADLQAYDVVITSYQTVTSQHLDPAERDFEPVKKKSKVLRSLFEVPWKRIILDEGHIIRNPRTKAAKAASALTAERRWVLSGTPIINSPRDLGSLLTFLKITKPLDEEEFFKRLLLRPLKDGDVEGAELLRALMCHICIRRTKEMQHGDGSFLVPLPPVEMVLVPVKMHPEARAFYDEVESLSKQAVQRYMDRGDRVAPPASVLSLLTRMRQIALHPGLVPASYLEDLRATHLAADVENDTPTQAKPLQITAVEKTRLQILLATAIEDNEECAICFDILHEPRITSCAHPFCLACITEVLMRDPKCPMDRRAIDTTHLIEPAPPTELTQPQLPVEEDDEDITAMRTGSSAKIDQLVHLLSLTPPNDKTLVFSQFTTFLDKIAEAFDEQGVSYVRFDGKMSAKRRQETIARFSVPITDSDSAPPAATVPPVTSTSRTRKRSSRAMEIDDFEDAGSDDNYVAGGGDSDDDDDKFIASDDDFPFPMSSQKSKSKGKGKAKAKPKSKTKKAHTYMSGENPRVMLISLKAGALGLNLTVANQVVLCDPWWQEGIESQAIDRCNRIGQTKPVHVYQLISENTVESKVLEIQERKKALIQQAFSGIKRKETVREKKEARLQDLVELFGLRKRAAEASQED